VEAQGYIFGSSLLYQDSKSIILLTKNGRMWTDTNGKHTKNRFFLVTDKVAQGGLSIQHLGTKNMLADVNLKPLKGLLSRKFHHERMGVPVGYDGDVEQRNTHTMLLPMVEIERATIPEKELLKGIVVLSPAKQNTTSKKVPKKGVPRGGDSKSISSRSGATSKKGVCWERVNIGPSIDPSGRLEDPVI
jgi:hypothetical protein